MKKQLLFFLLLIPVLTGSGGYAQSPSLNVGTVSPRKFYETYRYELKKGKIIVDVIINNKTYKFLLDTGAPFSISESIYNEVNPAVISEITVNDASGLDAKMKIISLPTLHWKGITFHNTSGLLLNENTGFMLACMGVDGIIGSNMLRNSILQFDFGQQRIILTNERKKVNLKQVNYQEMELSESQSNPFIKLLLKNGKEDAGDKVLFDTGDDAFYTISTDAYNWFQSKVKVIETISKSVGNGTTIGLHGIAGDQEQMILNIPELQLNTSPFPNVIAGNTNSAESRMGAQVLHYGIVTLDYIKKRFYFQPYPDRDLKDIRERPWAIAPSLENGKMIVGIIFDKSLESRINVGDIILTFNGISYQDKPICELLNSNNKFQETSAVVELVDIHTGNTKTVTISRL